MLYSVNNVNTSKHYIDNSPYNCHEIELLRDPERVNNVPNFR